MKARSSIVILALILSTLFPGVARADVAAAKKAFDSASQAYREGRYSEAVQLFLQAYEEDHQPQLIYNAAQAYEKAGDVPNALRSYRRFLRLDPGADDRPTVELRMKNLEQRLRDKGVQQVIVFSTPEGASVSLDGKSAGKTPWSAEIKPGRHVIVLQHDGLPDATKEFVLAADHSLELDITLGAATATPARTGGKSPETNGAQSPSSEPAADQRGARSIQPLTWAVLGVGVAALGVGIGFELARSSAEQDARDAPTQVEHKDDYDKMKSRQTTARVLAGVGAAGIVAGGVLLYFDLSRKPERKPERSGRAGLGLSCGALACGAFARGSF